MSVDKFGHFSKDMQRGNVPKIPGINFDKNNNLNIQNKKIKNLGSPAEDTDAVNKAYLHNQIEHMREVLKKEVNVELTDIRREITEMICNLNAVNKILPRIES